MSAIDQHSAGAEAFMQALSTASPTDRPIIERFAHWAQDELESTGLADLWTMTGVAPRDALLARIPGRRVCLVKGWIENGVASVQLHTSVWNRWAPKSKQLLRTLGVVFDGDWFGLYDWHERHLAVFALAYEEAIRPHAVFLERYSELAASLPTMPTRHRPQGMITEGDIVTVEHADGDVESYVIAPMSSRRPPPGVVSVSRDAPLSRALVGRRAGDAVSFPGPVSTVSVRILDVQCR